MERTKGGLERLQMALCFQQMKRKKTAKDHTDERRKRKKKVRGQETKERIR